MITDRKLLLCIIISIYISTTTASIFIKSVYNGQESATLAPPKIVPTLCDCKHRCQIDDKCKSVTCKRVGDVFAVSIDTTVGKLVFGDGIYSFCKEGASCESTKEEITKARTLKLISENNVALSKPAVASSIHDEGYEGSMAVDGNGTTMFRSEVNDSNVWLAIDLESSQLVSTLVFSGRKEFPERTGLIKVYFTDTIGEFDDFSSYRKILYAKVVPGAGWFHLWHVMMTRYVILEKVLDDVMELVEFKVLAIK